MPRPTGLDIGLVAQPRGLIDNYFAKLVAAGSDLGGMTIVVDGAFGAAYLIGPKIFERLGARVIALNCEDDGEPHQRRVRRDGSGHAARARPAGTGEHQRPGCWASRSTATPTGRCSSTRPGRSSAATTSCSSSRATSMQRGELPGDIVVGTVMSNMGFEKALEREGIRLLRAAVGDRYVLEAMRSGGYRFGGEQSGHVIDLQRGTTGDGPMTAVTLFSIAARARKPLHELAAGIAAYPQVLLNVRVSDKSVADHPAVRAAIAAAERELADDGRILVRPSGTEPLVRVMVEASDDARTQAVAESVAQTIRALG